MLHGSGDTEIEFRYTDARGRAAKRKHAFEGIIPNLERRYRETESATVREELGKYRGTRRCPDCEGTRLNETARHVFVGGARLPDVAALSVADALQHHLSLQVDGWRGEIATRIVKEVADRLRFLVDVGLDYLTLDRSAETLSGGEAQRIRLASQVGSGLTGVLYILDEPSIGLHQRDNQRLLTTLKRLRDLGNTVLVVEHDEEAILTADHVLDLGPGRRRAWRRGGGRRHARSRSAPTRTPSPATISPAASASRCRRGSTSAIRRARSASSAPGPTTCAASAPPFRSACSPASPACRARANPRW